jgi:hypothetical protein
LCERGSVGICCHESSHAEAVDPPVRTFHTVSYTEFSEVGWIRGISGFDTPLVIG